MKKKADNGEHYLACSVSGGHGNMTYTSGAILPDFVLRSPLVNIEFFVKFNLYITLISVLQSCLIILILYYYQKRFVTKFSDNYVCNKLLSNMRQW